MKNIIGYLYRAVLLVGVASLVSACSGDQSDTEKKHVAQAVETKPEAKVEIKAVEIKVKDKNPESTTNGISKDKKTVKKPEEKKKELGPKIERLPIAKSTLLSASNTKTAETAASETTEKNPIVSMDDRDAFRYLLVGSKGACDKSMNYSQEVCDAFIKQVTNPQERWYLIVKHYNIKPKHFHDQRVYQRMQKELTEVKTDEVIRMRAAYGIKTAKTSE